MNHLRLTLPGLLALLLLLQPARATEPTVGLQEVTKANEAFYAALNEMFKGEMGPMEAVWSHAPDVTYLPPDGKFRLGWDAVKADWEAQAKMKLGGSVRPEGVHVVTGDRLAVVQNWEVGENKDAEGKPIEVKIRATNVYRKEDGGWKMISHHADVLPYLKKKQG